MSGPVAVGAHNPSTMPAFLAPLQSGPPSRARDAGEHTRAAWQLKVAAAAPEAGDADSSSAWPAAIGLVAGTWLGLS
eukprot:CAMPEP_0197940346 /NCGR_PEP_ID=MMETSP1439-20131203/121100_1 /TAXON_ID=66791 /ORGANISM="Gonyaulax spinifera, Strain CCMP409" /LENGTH=76 /DNA_ID=CAMNT_0043563507 /DNA_START=46 /DNA_END=272 /DNA_ORIENTATION=+